MRNVGVFFSNFNMKIESSFKRTTRFSYLLSSFSADLPKINLKNNVIKIVFEALNSRHTIDIWHHHPTRIELQNKLMKCSIIWTFETLTTSLLSRRIFSSLNKIFENKLNRMMIPVVENEWGRGKREAKRRQFIKLNDWRTFPTFYRIFEKSHSLRWNGAASIPDQEFETAATKTSGKTPRERNFTIQEFEVQTFDSDSMNNLHNSR